MSDLKLPPVNRPSLGERLPPWAVVAIVAGLLVVLAGAGVLVRGTQAQAPTPIPVTAVPTLPPGVSPSPTEPVNDWADPETVTKKFFAAYQRTRSHPQDLSALGQYVLPGSIGVATTNDYFTQVYIEHDFSFVVSDSTVGGCTVSDGPLWTRPPGTQTPRADLILKHVVCQVSFSGQDADLAGTPVGTHDPIWHATFSTEVQQFNGLWYVEDWRIKVNA